MKGIVLAGGAGTRLFPATKIYSKQLALLYDKPLIYYPLSILMLAGIKEILIISDEATIPLYKQLFENGSYLGLELKYAVQKAPNGIAESFLIGEEFIDNDSVTLILGDNIFYGKLDYLYNALQKKMGATIFAYRVNDPQRYGIIEFDTKGVPLSIEEKPLHPRSQFAIPGLYVYDNQVISIAKGLKPSARGELEITDVNKSYMLQNELDVIEIGRGVAWLDTGTPQALLQAANFFGVIEDRQGLKVACLEEIAYNKGFISKENLKVLVQNYPKSSYKEYLERLLNL